MPAAILTIPMLIHLRSPGAAGAAVLARPLLRDSPVAEGSQLGRTMSRATEKIRGEIAAATGAGDTRSLVRWHHEGPPPVGQTLTVHLELRDRTADLKLFVVTMEALGRTVGFSPQVADVWFDVPAGEDLRGVAASVYEEHFRGVIREETGHEVKSHTLTGQMMIDEITLPVPPPTGPKKKIDPLAAFFGGDDVSGGAEQLRRVGRCLNHLDASQLADPIDVEDDVRRIERLLRLPQRRGIAIVGPAGSGKSARVQGVVTRRMEARAAGQPTPGGQLWQLTPSGLIAGMCYLGQWQQRLLGILRHAHRADHVLILEDLLAWFHTGQTRDCEVSLADALRSQLNVGPVRWIAEFTPAAWAIFRRRMPSVAGTMIVVPTTAMNTTAATEVLVAMRARVEQQHRGLEINNAAIGQVVSLYDRLDRSTCLPGKAVDAMARLVATAKPGNGKTVRIGAAEVFGEVASRTGVSMSVIDRRSRPTRKAWLDRVAAEVIGQDSAVAALVDRALVAAAGLADPDRPIGTYLMVGPTGVGKTQLAKAIAGCLFDQGGLIRIDMNELSSPWAVSRLMGTHDHPDGLLTGTVARRPHAVLLLDEIEKAHPSVLDALLPVLGEARMTDAAGRTIDFSGLLVLMTSNLGSRTAGRAAGFDNGQNNTAIGEHHRRAAEAFFRPEFFNRIDDVLSFNPLPESTIEKIARIQVRQILARDGLTRRGVVVDLVDDALSQVARRGFDPRMGARALKRQLQRDLVEPAAAVLARLPGKTPVLMRVEAGSAKAVQVRCEPIETVAALPPAGDMLQVGRDLVETIRRSIDTTPLRFEAGRDVDPSTLRTMHFREEVHVISALLDSAERARDVTPADNRHFSVRQPVERSREYDSVRGAGWQRQELAAVDAIDEYLDGDHVDPINEKDLAMRIGRLRAVWQTRDQPLECCTTLQHHGAGDWELIPRVVEHWLGVEGLEVKTKTDGDRVRLDVGGVSAAACLRAMAGGWLFDDAGRLSLLSVRGDEAYDKTSGGATPPVRWTLRRSGVHTDHLEDKIVHGEFWMVAMMKQLQRVWVPEVRR